VAISVALLDTTLILFLHVPQGIKEEDWFVWWKPYLIYLGLMAFALFPFQEERRE